MPERIASALARQIVTMTLTAALMGCGADITQPSTPPQGALGSPAPFVVPPSCQPEGANVRCSVLYHDTHEGFRDVTPLATWQVSSSALLAQPTAVAAVEAPGLIVPHAAGNIAVSASYNGTVNLARHAFAVAPDRAAIALAPSLLGHVLETDGVTGIVGATVELLDGPTAGRTVITRETGYFLYEFLPMDVPFTVRASKPGYETVTETHPGIADNTDGFPVSTLFNLRLRRMP